jgi:acyl CoA:acetate/3-ketoacid CoA transferase beta subunit
LNLLTACTLSLTGRTGVSRVITNLGVSDTTGTAFRIAVLASSVNNIYVETLSAAAIIDH